MEVGVVVVAGSGAAGLAGAIALFSSLAEVGRIVVVGPSGQLDVLRREAETAASGKAVTVREGDDTRQHAVRAGLEEVGPCDCVLVHDAARPPASPAVIRRVVQAALLSGAAVPALPPAAPVLRVESGRVVEILDRGHLMLVQTPQGFRYQLLRRAHFEAADAGLEGDDIQLVLATGHEVAVVEGERSAGCES
jgi:2-C-methyl-D-erythritol 4-phosphate cytidylyltransferase